MTSIFDKLAGFISGRAEGRATKGKLSDFLTENSRVINQVVNDIFRPYLDPKTKKSRDITHVLSLLDADTCSQMMIFLSNTMEANLERYDVGGLGSSLAILNDPSKCHAKGGNCTRALNEKTIETKPGMKISKRDMCDTIAVHYVKLLNLIGSILVAINPDTNMCLARFNNLYTLIETDGEGQAFQVGLCTNKKVIRDSLLKEPGLAEFLQLYLYHLVKQTETEADKQAVIREYANLVTLLEDEGVIESVESTEETQPPTMHNTKADTGFIPELPLTGTENEVSQVEMPQQQQSENLSAAIRRLENRFQELETSQRANKNINRAARNSELKAEIAELKATIADLTELVKTGKATPANVAQTIDAGTQTNTTTGPARNISAATFNANTNSEASHQARNVNKMNTYENEYGNMSNSYRNYGYGAAEGYDQNSEKDSSRKLERLEGRLVKLLKKLNSPNSRNSTNSTNSGSSRAPTNYESEPESYGSESSQYPNNNSYADYESTGGSSLPYNKSIQSGGSPNTMNANQQTANANTNIMFGYSNKPNEATELPNEVLEMPIENAGLLAVANQEEQPVASERTQQFMSAASSMERFRLFMKDYTADNPQVRNMFLKVFNAKFKSPRKEKIDRICTNAKSKGRLFTVNVSEASENADIKAFVDNYSAMKQEYMAECGRLVDILEDRILEQVPDNESSQANSGIMRYVLRDLNGAELKEIETLTRQTLAALYGKCHRRYLEGINHLDSYFFNKTKRQNVMVD
jgi:hypothetical protein